MPTEHAFEVPTAPSSWCARLHREHPDLAVELVGIFPGADGEIIETVSVAGRDAMRAIDTIRFTETVHHFEIIHQRGDACTVRLKTHSCEPCLAAQLTRIAPTFPMLVAGGTCHWRVQTSPEKARAFAGRLEQTHHAPTLTRKRWMEQKPVLTPRQREILQAAVTQGYYARPRRLSLTELAGHLKIRKSSLSQTLATIEAKLLPRCVEHLSDDA